MRQRADSRHADGKMAVVRISEPDASGFDEQTKLVAVDERYFGVRAVSGPREGCGLLRRKNGFVECAVWQADTALKTLAKWANGFEDDGHVEVPKKVHRLPDWQANWPFVHIEMT